MPKDFSNSDFWKGIILYGLNNTTYKIALGKTLLRLSKDGYNKVDWDILAKHFFEAYQHRLSNDDAMPQQGNPNRWTKMERTIRNFKLGRLSQTKAVEEVAHDAFNDVIPRFQTIGTDKEIVKGFFYEFDFGKSLRIKDSLHKISETDFKELNEELDARWSLLEGAFKIKRENFQLQNDILDIYLENGYKRTNLSPNVPFLKGYQGNLCFYCSEPISDSHIHVDHVLPRMILNHDEIWNLVLSHSICNLKKGDAVVGKHFIDKLIYRNENIIGSNHPWKQKIKNSLGRSPAIRARALENHYNNVKSALNNNYWDNAPNYNPSKDPFYRKFITVLNNK